jgi:hypothetical protein
MPKKTGSDQAIVETLIDARARSGRGVRFLKTDGDGVFVSGSFEEIRGKYGFVHERSAPDDHYSNAEIEREIRTTFEGVTTALEASGAPAFLGGGYAPFYLYEKYAASGAGGGGGKNYLQIRSVYFEPGSSAL